MTFDSYNWQDVEISDPNAKHARQRIRDGSKEPDDLHTLLRSGEIVAACVAMEVYDYAESISRHGMANPYRPAATEILVAARTMLDGPYLSASSTGAAENGMNHISALIALHNLGESIDAEVVARSLRYSSNENLTEAALAAASTVLSEAPTNPYLISSLVSLAEERRHDVRDRIRAVSVLGVTPSEAIANHLVRLTRSSDEDIRNEAAIVLSGYYLESHRNQIEEITSSWIKPLSIPQIHTIRKLYRPKEGDF